MDIQQRLDVFFRRLADAPPAANAEEALRPVCRLIEEVEEELCPVTREQPAPLTASGRMYAPKQDHTLLRDDGHIVAQTRHHEVQEHRG